MRVAVRLMLGLGLVLILALGAATAAGLRRQRRTQLGEHPRDVAELELRQRRARHVAGLRRNAERMVDEHLAVLGDEHRRSGDAFFFCGEDERFI